MKIALSVDLSWTSKIAYSDSELTTFHMWQEGPRCEPGSHHIKESFSVPHPLNPISLFGIWEKKKSPEWWNPETTKNKQTNDYREIGNKISPSIM